MKILLLIATIIFSDCNAQNVSKLRDGLLVTVLDRFIAESITKFDSIQIKEKNAGFIVIELISNDLDLLPFLYSELMVERIPSHPRLSYEIRINFLFNCEYLYGKVPSAVVEFKSRHVIFYTAINRLLEFDSKTFLFLKKRIGKQCIGKNNSIRWLVIIDENESNPINVVSKIIE